MALRDCPTCGLPDGYNTLFNSQLAILRCFKYGEYGIADWRYEDSIQTRYLPQQDLDLSRYKLQELQQAWQIFDEFPVVASSDDIETVYQENLFGFPPYYSTNDADYWKKVIEQKRDFFRSLREQERATAGFATSGIRNGKEYNYKMAHFLGCFNPAAISLAAVPAYSVMCTESFAGCRDCGNLIFPIRQTTPNIESFEDFHRAFMYDGLFLRGNNSDLFLTVYALSRLVAEFITLYGDDNDLLNKLDEYELYQPLAYLLDELKSRGVYSDKTKPGKLIYSGFEGIPNAKNISEGLAAVLELDSVNNLFGAPRYNRVLWGLIDILPVRNYFGIEYHTNFYFRVGGLESVVSDNSETNTQDNDVQIEDFEIQVGVLKKYQGSSEIVVVPDGVMEIGDAAFRGNQTIKSVILPNSIIIIGTSAFDGCINLNSVNLPNSLAEIHSHAFSGCVLLSEILLPTYLSVIGYAAFSGCEGLRSISIPDNIEVLGSCAFFRCLHLAEVKLPADLESLYDGLFSGCLSLSHLNFPDGLKTIGEWAFSGSSLSYVHLPDGVESIESDAFKDCAELTSINLPNSLNNLGTGIFDGCIKLANVAVSDSLLTRKFRVLTQLLADTSALESLKSHAQFMQIDNAGAQSTQSDNYAARNLDDSTEVSQQSGNTISSSQATVANLVQNETAEDPEASDAGFPRNLVAGGKVIIGGNNWVVQKTEGEYALLMAEDNLAEKPFHSVKKLHFGRRAA